MQPRRYRFDDFHTFGASAPEWNQRYQQVSRGAMHSAMTEVSAGGIHLFRKTLSQRVVQQGCVPVGKLCFAVPARAADSARMQGRSVGDNSLFVLRGGEEFVLHRPAQMELLAATVDAQAFRQLLHAHPDAARLQPLLRRTVLEIAPGAMALLRAQLDAMFMHSAGIDLQPLVQAALLDALQGASHGGHRAVGLSAHVLVSECQRLTLDRLEAPPTIEELCQRLRTSRRSLQDSFRTVALTTPVDYLRAMRLNRVRQQLHRTLAHELSIGDIAGQAGFTQLSHFAVAYRRLFGELPSQTLRADALALRLSAP